MRRWSAGTLAVFLVAAFAVSPAWAVIGIVRPLVPVTVTPAAPGTRTTLTVSFTLPTATENPPAGASTTVERHLDTVAIHGPQRTGCVDAGSAQVPSAAAGTTVHVKLSPRALGGTQWCTGRYTGEVTESTMPDCNIQKHQLCPMYVVIPQVIGRFRFTVAAD